MPFLFTEKLERGVKQGKDGHPDHDLAKPSSAAGFLRPLAELLRVVVHIREIPRRLAELEIFVFAHLVIIGSPWGCTPYPAPT